MENLPLEKSGSKDIAQAVATRPLHDLSATENDEGNLVSSSVEKGLGFWLVFMSMCLAAFAANLNATILTTILPTITRDIGGREQYVWIGNSYTIAATAIQPLFGQIANIFGWRSPMLFSVAAFALGNGIAGGAKNVPMLITGRTVQGIGGGGIMMLLELITCDLVPLRKRSKYIAIVLSACSLGVTLGPVVGGAFLKRTS